MYYNLFLCIYTHLCVHIHKCIHIYIHIRLYTCLGQCFFMGPNEPHAYLSGMISVYICICHIVFYLCVLKCMLSLTVAVYTLNICIRTFLVQTATSVLPLECITYVTTHNSPLSF